MLVAGGDRIKIGDSRAETILRTSGDLLNINGAHVGGGIALPTAVRGGIFLLLEDNAGNDKGLYYSTDGGEWVKS